MGLSFTAEDEPDLTVPEDTIIRCQLVEIKPKMINWNDKQTGEAKSRQMLEFWWQVKAPERFSARKLKGECDAKLTNHPDNRFRQWAEALLDRQIPVGMGIDTDDIVGLTADVTVRHEKSKDGQRIFERVDMVMPASGGGIDQSSTPPF